MTFHIINGDSRVALQGIKDQTVQTIVTSPPYWSLRDYGEEGQIGLEDTLDGWLSSLGDVFDECRRVLRRDGTLWVNCGDAYMGQGGNGKMGRNSWMSDRKANRAGVRRVPPKGKTNLRRKDLIGLPWRLAFELQSRGWILRSDIIWAKTNPMPESVQDRPTKAHEYIFLFSRSRHYFFDPAGIAEKSTGRPNTTGYAYQGRIGDRGNPEPTAATEYRNGRTIWDLYREPWDGDHFATFPVELPTKCIRAGSREGDLVLDPFAGVGTTGLAATRLNRHFLGVELSLKWCNDARRRILDDAPLLNGI